MKTRVIPVDPSDPDEWALREAATAIHSGALVAFPTETVYGLGADAFNDGACRAIYAVKGRAPADPCIVHIANLEQLARVTRSKPGALERLAADFWPGPLSLVLPKSKSVPDVVTAGLPTVAVRMPAHPVALALIKVSGTPIAAPSANRFGHISPTTAQHVVDDLGGRIPLVLDAGQTAIGLESTVLDLTQEPPRLLRPGGVALEQLQNSIGEIQTADVTVANEERQTSPGQLARHYAPSVPLKLFEGARNSVLAAVERAAQELVRDGCSVGLLLADEDHIEVPSHVQIVRLGSEGDGDAIAHHLFASLRELEAAGVHVILARTFDTDGKGRAIADRLRRAASGDVTRV